jgi:hypothetical protein
MKTDFYTKVMLTIIVFCLFVLILQGGISKAEANGTNNSGYALIPINADGSVNVHVKSVDGEQEVIVVGWKEKFVNWKTYDLAKDPLPTRLR